MTDENMDLEKWKADVEAKSRRAVGPPLSKEEQELREKTRVVSPLTKKYADSNG